MPLVKVHGPADLSPEQRLALLARLREALRALPGVADDGGHAVYYASQERAVHASRDARFVFVELSALGGRSDDAKQALAKAVFEATREVTGVADKDIQVNLSEFERRHWFVGGVPMSKL